MKTIRNATKLLGSINAMVTGLKAEPPAGLTALGVGGKSYSLADLETKLTTYGGMLQGLVDAETAVEAAHLVLVQVGPELTLFVQQAQGAIKGALGKKSASLPVYGLAADKTPAPLTAEKEAQKVARMRATRKARNTMGKRQKAAVKGQVPPAPAAPTAPAAPGK
jgi:hypothetical protein